MANSIQGQSRKVKLWKNRPVIVLQEMDGHEYYFHGVMIGPKGMTLAKALKALDKCYLAAVKADPEEWNYDDVIANMKKAGFEEVLAAEWWEEAVDVPEGIYSED